MERDLKDVGWEKLREVLQALYEPGPTSATGWSAPRRLPTSKVYLVSFCEVEDSLDLWRAYGANGHGVCMVMPLSEAAKHVVNPDWAFFGVAYDELSMGRAWLLLEKPLIEAWADVAAIDAHKRLEALRSILQTVSSVFHLYKHEQFKTESEIRLVYRGTPKIARTEKIGDELRPIVETDRFFLKAPGCKIILGPLTVDRNRRIASLEVLLDKVFAPHVPEVQISGVPYQ